MLLVTVSVIPNFTLQTLCDVGPTQIHEGSWKRWAAGPHKICAARIRQHFLHRMDLV